MTEKRFTLGYEDDFLRWIRDNHNRKDYVVKIGFGEEDNLQDVCDLLNELSEDNEELKKEVDYWKQIASQYNNVLNVYKHCKKNKTECKDIHWSSD